MLRQFIVTLSAVTLVVSSSAAPAAGSSAVPYTEPVQGVVIDHFRPPPTPYSAGNRGLDYLTTPGSEVHSAADGEVIFAGQVAGALHVTIRHPDGLRTSYSFLAAIGVAEGQRVRRGDTIGTTGSLFHVGVRTPDGTYLDPEALFSGRRSRVRVRLVPGADEGRRALGGSEWRELLDLVRSEGAQLFGRLGALTPESVGLLGHYAMVLRPDKRLLRAEVALADWNDSRRRCTPANESPPQPGGRRIVIEVGGLGSSSDGAAVFGIDSTALGYADSDVVRFSYAGGRTPADTAGPAGGLDSLPSSTYTPADTQDDLRGSGERLAELVQGVARVAPGVPIDVVAHSQGGVVARLAVDQLSTTGSLPPQLATIVTLGSPHQGSDLATAVAAAESANSGAVGLQLIRGATGLDLDPTSPSITQLSEISPLQADLSETTLPEGVRFTSVSASGDMTVPAPRTAVPGAARAVVRLDGLHAHDELPSSPATTREIALAIAGRSPTCVGFGAAFDDFVVGETISTAEDLMGLAALLANGAGP